MKFGAYLKQLIDASGMNEAQLSSRMKIKSRGYLTQVEKGLSLPPNEERCNQIADILEITKDERQTLIHLSLVERSPEEFKPYVEKGLGDSSNVIGLSQNLKDYVRVPLLGSCPASPKNWMADDTQAWHYLPKELIKNRRLYLLKVCGDSLTKAGIDDGDVILIDADAQPINGDIVVVRIDNECTAKRYYRDGNQVTLMPESHNGNHKPLSLDIKKTEIILRGVVDSIFMKKLRRTK